MIARLFGYGLLIAAAILARQILLLAFLAMLIAVALSFPVGLLSRVMRRGLAVILALVLAVGTLTGIGFATAPVLSDQFQSVVKRMPEAVSKFEEWSHRLEAISPVGKMARDQQITGQVGEKVGNVIEVGVSKIFPAAIGVVAWVSTAILVLVLAAFLVFQPEVYWKGARLLVPRGSEEEFDEGRRRLSQGLRHWVGGIFISMTILGTFVATGAKIAGIQNWFLLGVLTFFGTFIPYLGAIASSVPGLLMGLSQSTHHFVAALIVYCVAHVLEGYIVQPFIMRKAVELRPAVLLLGQAVLGMLLGLLGVVVASPLLVCLQLGVGYFYVERKLGKTPKV